MYLRFYIAYNKGWALAVLYIGDVSDWMGTWHAFVYFNVLLKINQTRLVVIVT